VLDRTAAIRRDSARMAELAASADLDARVPCCPDWDLRRLATHIGEVQLFWAGCLRTRRADTPWSGRAPGAGSDAGLGPWMGAATAELLAALDEVGDDSPCWTWWGEPATAGAVGRHQGQEAAVHRWDAESTVGPAAPLDAAVAHDGVAEFLDVMLSPGTAALRGVAPPDLPGTVTLTSSDTDGRWTAGAGTGPGATVRAGASDLVLWLYGRVPQSGVDVEGDRGAVDALLQAVRTG
jgi:uncharacterized protein (TIGR03083 family)